MGLNSSSEGFSPGFCEYLVPGYAGKNMNIIRVIGIVIGLALTAVVFSLLSIIPQIVFIWLVVVVFFEILLFHFTSREFEYTVAMGELSVDAIYGRQWRRRMITLRIKDADRIFPVESFKDSQILRLNADRVIYASPKNSEFMYCFFTKEIGGKNSKTALVFTSCKKLNDAIKFYNRACFTERK